MLNKKIRLNCILHRWLDYAKEKRTRPDCAKCLAYGGETGVSGVHAQELVGLEEFDYVIEIARGKGKTICNKASEIL